MTAGEPHFDGREMETMHKMFRREFALMPGLVQNVPDGHRERTQIVADHLSFVNTAVHNHHHSRTHSFGPCYWHGAPTTSRPTFVRCRSSTTQSSAPARR